MGKCGEVWGSVGCAIQTVLPTLNLTTPFCPPYNRLSLRNLPYTVDEAELRALAIAAVKARWQGGGACFHAFSSNLDLSLKGEPTTMP